MILLSGVAIGLFIGRLSGGRFAGLVKPGFRGLPIPVLAYFFQAVELAVYRIAGFSQFHPALTLISYAMIFLFYSLNRRYSLGSLLGFAGTACNFAVIALNGFHMPVATNPLWGPDLSGHVVNQLGYRLANEGTVLLALGDVMALNIPYVGGLFSVGDVLIVAGCACLVVSAMRAASLPGGEESTPNA